MNMKSITESNRGIYDILAPEYFGDRKLFEECSRAVAEKFVWLLDRRYPYRPIEDISVLDVGVGSGLHLSIFEENGYKTYGIDISSRMIEFARITSPNSRYYCGDFLGLDFGRKFSGIFAQAFIHLYPKEDTVKIFEKMHSILEPGGLIHFSTTLHEMPSEGWEVKTDYEQKVARFRKRWTLDELDTFISGLPDTERIDAYSNSDPKGKMWINNIISPRHMRQ